MKFNLEALTPFAPQNNDFNPFTRKGLSGPFWGRSHHEPYTYHVENTCGWKKCPLQIQNIWVLRWLTRLSRQPPQLWS